jgi:hypothetical protein
VVVNNLKNVNQNLVGQLNDTTSAKLSADVATSEAIEKLYQCLNNKCLNRG